MSLPADDLLSAYHDGELTAAERAIVEQHLATSAEARRELSEIGQLSTLLQDVPRASLPSEFPQQVLQGIEREMLIPSGRASSADAAWADRMRTWWASETSPRRWAISAAAVLTSAAGLFLLVRSLSDESGRASRGGMQLAAHPSATGNSGDVTSATADAKHRQSGFAPAPPAMLPRPCAASSLRRSCASACRRPCSRCSHSAAVCGRAVAPRAPRAPRLR